MRDNSCLLGLKNRWTLIAGSKWCVSGSLTARIPKRPLQEIVDEAAQRASWTANLVNAEVFAVLSRIHTQAVSLARVVVRPEKAHFCVRTFTKHDVLVGGVIPRTPVAEPVAFPEERADHTELERLGPFKGFIERVDLIT